MGRIITVSDGACGSVTVSNWGGGLIIMALLRPLTQKEVDTGWT
jgi:hypothetical protein